MKTRNMEAYRWLWCVSSTQCCVPRFLEGCFSLSSFWGPPLFSEDVVCIHHFFSAYFIRMKWATSLSFLEFLPLLVGHVIQDFEIP